MLSKAGQPLASGMGNPVEELTLSYLPKDIKLVNGESWFELSWAGLSCSLLSDALPKYTRLSSYLCVFAHEVSANRNSLSPILHFLGSYLSFKIHLQYHLL